jgi:predicted nucleic acid-binding protein
VSAVYAESSAVLRWLLGAGGADQVADVLRSADTVVTSELTAAEVGRTLQRLAAAGHLDPSAGARAWEAYTQASAHWHLYGVTDGVLRRARQSFPLEPVRTLDAVHLSTAMLYALDVGPPMVLSTDLAVRANAEALGLAIAPRAALA